MFSQHTNAIMCINKFGFWNKITKCIYPILFWIWKRHKTYSIQLNKSHIYNEITFGCSSVITQTHTHARNTDIRARWWDTFRGRSTCMCHAMNTNRLFYALHSHHYTRWRQRVMCRQYTGNWLVASLCTGDLLLTIDTIHFLLLRFSATVPSVCGV